MIAKARANKVLIEPKLISDIFADELREKTGMELSTPKHQGIPVMGRVLDIGDEVKAPDLAVGDFVFFYQARPVGFDMGGVTQFSIRPEMIKAKARIHA